jgi:hypothetical protein
VLEKSKSRILSQKLVELTESTILAFLLGFGFGLGVFSPLAVPSEASPLRHNERS